MPFIVTPLVNSHAGIYIHTPYNYVVLTWIYDYNFLCIYCNTWALITKM